MMILYVLAAATLLFYILKPRLFVFLLASYHIFYLSLGFLYFKFLITGDDPHKMWSTHLTKLFKLSLVDHPTSKQIESQQKTMILVNHRSMADVWYHDVATNHNCNFLSRGLVAVVMPFTWLISRRYHQVWFFKRGGRGDNLEPFFKWIDVCWNDPCLIRKNMLVYPEGHRNTGPKPLPLKKGMIQYSYTRKIPVQIVITKGHEYKYHEKLMVASLDGATVTRLVDDKINPDQFSTFDDYYKHVEKRFGEMFFTLYKD